MTPHALSEENEKPSAYSTGFFHAPAVSEAAPNKSRLTTLPPVAWDASLYLYSITVVVSLAMIVLNIFCDIYGVRAVVENNQIMGLPDAASPMP